MNIDEGLSKKINQVNVICTLLIVCLHSSFSQPSNGVKVMEIQFFMMKLITVITTVSVPMFFAISSYLYFSKYSGIHDYMLMLKKRLRSVLIPFGIWNLLALAYYNIIVRYTNLFDSKTVPNNIEEVIKYVWYSEGVPPLWYLRELFIFVLFAPFIGICISKLKEYSIILVPVSGVIVRILDIRYDSIIFWLPAIYGGAWLAKYGTEILKLNCKKKISVASLGIYLIISLFLSFFHNEYSVWFYIWRFVSVILFWLIIIQIDTTKINYFKKYTFFIYCIHFILIEAIRGVLIKCLSIHEWSVFIIYILTIFSTLISAVILGNTLQRFFPKFWKFINGGRK